MTVHDTRHYFEQQGVCLVIPTYQNASTIVDVVERAMPFCADIFVVDDGCTDDTVARLAASHLPVTLVCHDRNRGKGAALRSGFAAARKRGFHVVITLDADGQHYPEDLPCIATAMQAHRDAIITGNRHLQADNMPARNTFANRFSNFWFTMQTARRLDDTQCGFRAYPLKRLPHLPAIVHRYEAELYLLVVAAWHNVKIYQTPIRVYYPPAAERVSHFRPFQDFARISVINTLFCIAAIIYGYPRMLLTHLFGR